MDFETIAKDVKSFSDKKFAEWFKPFIHFENTPEDILLGIRVPILRKLAKKYQDIDNKILLKLLQNKVRDFRQLAILIMILKAIKSPNEMCKIYLNNLRYINNWDLIDVSAAKIVAPNVSKDKLRELANSDYMWANRVAVVATLYYIKKKDFELTFEFAIKNFNHPHYLMHKASGWMLREVGKQDERVLVEFLKKYSSEMPAIMHSYAIERLKYKYKSI